MSRAFSAAQVQAPKLGRSACASAVKQAFSKSAAAPSGGVSSVSSSTLRAHNVTASSNCKRTVGEMMFGSNATSSAAKFTPNSPTLRRHLRNTAAAVSNVLLDAAMSGDTDSTLASAGASALSLDESDETTTTATRRAKRKRRRF
ncbi:hypothetical protein PPROV_000492900 [Pycnococcus provasolii]|uniref:Uncharacterized protein n=1 Tax=Pycnococcus provasolii TaxID=41880 RepID=A0A830HHB9_9CHLO|nr:hypothetical protein PPROV_000492900 [Pycnococcus provasolii]